MPGIVIPPLPKSLMRREWCKDQDKHTIDKTAISIVGSRWLSRTSGDLQEELLNQLPLTNFSLG
jgi:hypothetical protein